MWPGATLWYLPRKRTRHQCPYQQTTAYELRNALDKPMFNQGMRAIYYKDIRTLVQNHWEPKAAFCTSEWTLGGISRVGE
jgi:hypothetical protein